MKEPVANAAVQVSPAIMLPGGEVTRDAALATCPALHTTALRVMKYYSAQFFKHCLVKMFACKQTLLTEKLQVLTAHVAWLHVKVRHQLH
jgi:hypothetical protein